MTTLTAQQRAFLDGPRHAIVATLGKDGTPSQSVLWYARDGDTLWISVRPDSVKARHIRRDGRISILVLSADNSGYLRIDGTAAIDGEVDRDARRALIGRYVGAARAEAWMAGHPLPTPNARIRIHPARVAAVNIGA